MSTENTSEVVQPSPFNEGSWNTTPPVKQEPIVEEKKEPIQDLPEEKKKAPEDTLNEESKKLYAAIKAGKTDDVLSILSQQQTFAKLDTLKPEEIIRLNLQYANKDYTPNEIADLFEEKYSLPTKPEQETLESDEDFAQREKEYKSQLERVERKIARDSKDAKTELSKYKQKLILPDIPQENPKPQEPTQEELAAIEAQRVNFLTAVDGTFKDFNDYQATFKDEEVEIPVAYKIDPKEKESLKPLLNSLNTDLPQFFQQLEWVDKEGNLNMKKVVSDLHILQNKDAVIQKFVNEAGNKRYAEAIKAQKNIDFSGQQRRGSLEPSVREKVDKEVRGFLAAT